MSIIIQCYWYIDKDMQWLSPRSQNKLIVAKESVLENSDPLMQHLVWTLQTFWKAMSTFEILNLAILIYIFQGNILKEERCCKEMNTLVQCFTNIC